jgi:dTDP-glucose pyrophosphorylase
MNAVILAGGLDTLLVEETTTRPKPMLEIESRPILWRIIYFCLKLLFWNDVPFGITPIILATFFWLRSIAGA